MVICTAKPSRLWARRFGSINARSVSSRKKNRSDSVRDGAPSYAAYFAACSSVRNSTGTPDLHSQ